MPVSGEFTPDLIARYDEGLVRFINENFLAIKRVFDKVAYETISTIPPSSPYDGQKYIDTTNNIEYIYDAGVSNWLAISQWGAWLTTFTPVVGQGGALAKTTVRSSYTKEGRRVHFSGHCNLTAAGVGGNVITVSLPAAAVVPSNLALEGNAYLYDASANVNIPLTPIVNTSATLGFIYSEARAGGVVGVVNDPVLGVPFQLANGDAILWGVCYESTS